MRMAEKERKHISKRRDHGQFVSDWMFFLVNIQSHGSAGILRGAHRRSGNARGISDNMASRLYSVDGGHLDPLALSRGDRRAVKTCWGLPFKSRCLFEIMGPFYNIFFYSSQTACVFYCSLGKWFNLMAMLWTMSAYCNFILLGSCEALRWHCFMLRSRQFITRWNKKHKKRPNLNKKIYIGRMVL